METSVRLDKLRLAVVEDNPHMMVIIKTILRGFGIKEFIGVRDPVEGWEKVCSEPLDILILDRILGRADGLDLVRRIRNDPHSPNPYLPVVMLTAHSERTRVEEARDAGVTEFCCKPVTPKDLFTKVAMVIDKPRPFVRTKEFFGPDRRRHDDAVHGSKGRRKDDQSPGEPAEPLQTAENPAADAA